MAPSANSNIRQSSHHDAEGQTHDYQGQLHAGAPDTKQLQATKSTPTRKRPTLGSPGRPATDIKSPKKRDNTSGDSFGSYQAVVEKQEAQGEEEQTAVECWSSQFCFHAKEVR